MFGGVEVDMRVCRGAHPSPRPGCGMPLLFRSTVALQAKVGFLLRELELG